MATQTPSLDRRSLLRGTVTLAGAAVVLPTMASLAGCTSAPADLAPHRQLLNALIDRIIPATETPGALDAGVGDYIAAVFEQHFTEDQQADFITGLDLIAAEASSELPGGFASGSADEQDAALTRVAALPADAPSKVPWQQLRDMAIFGFYTSEAATQELAYEEIPGRYDGCVPLSEIGSAWLERGV